MYTVFCSLISPSLCVGLSIAPSDIPLPPLQLQLKSITKRYFVNGSDEQDNKINWFVSTSDKLLTAANVELAIGTLPQNRIGVVGVNDSEALEWLFPDNFTRLEVLGENRCMTIMRCQRKPLGYCDPDSIIPAESAHVPGSFIKLRSCESTRPASQSFIKFEHSCSRELLFNRKCDEECNNRVFQYDLGHCLNTTMSPTFSVAPTTRRPTLSDTPTYSRPTFKPTTSRPTLKPTTSKPSITPTNEPTNEPTDEQTNEPTIEPTIEPTNEPTKTQTNSPTVINPDIRVPFTTPSPTYPAGFFDSTYTAQLEYLWFLVLIIPLVFLFGYCTRK